MDKAVSFNAVQQKNLIPQIAMTHSYVNNLNQEENRDLEGISPKNRPPVFGMKIAEMTLGTLEIFTG
ncbi:hypothetical protein P5E51_16235, partial [Clostridium perfringens]|nr:hypothetical protein [Clostridium perfringens]